VPSEKSAADTNALIGALLRDLASAQTSTQSRWGYKRAAAAVLALDEPIEAFLRPDGTLRKIANIGPSSTRVILEVLRTGGSPTVDNAVAASGKAGDVERSRGLRVHFLSRARVLAILRDPKIRAVGRDDYHGDLQMHSTWSDGSETVAALADGCLGRGYRYCAVTDHSYGLPIARGVSMASLARQHAEIDRLNRRLGPRFRVIKGIEANIRADGEVDMLPEERRRLDLVLAAPHSKLRIEADQTARMIAAIATSGVHVLAHPRGRMFGSRAGISAKWDRVFAAAARRGVAVEIDGDPSRQDLDFTLARRALAAGCLFALDSDAHSSAELRYADTAIAHARLAGIPASRIINCWELDRLLEWAAKLRD
jgi:histidinol phosphatase-like PHP family hydrolase